MNKNLPLEIFTNADHTSSKLRKKRIGINKEKIKTLILKLITLSVKGLKIL